MTLLRQAGMSHFSTIQSRTPLLLSHHMRAPNKRTCKNHLQIQYNVVLSYMLNIIKLNALLKCFFGSIFFSQNTHTNIITL